MHWDCPQPYLIELSVKMSDIDDLGHANNLVYIKWAEQAAWSHTDSLGLSLAEYQISDRAMAITKASYEYLLPCFASENLVMATWLSACDNKLKVERRFQLKRENKTLFRGHWITTCVRLSSGKIARMPKDFINTYGGAVQKTTLT